MQTASSFPSKNAKEREVISAGYHRTAMTISMRTGWQRGNGNEETRDRKVFEVNLNYEENSALGFCVLLYERRLKWSTIFGKLGHVQDPCS
jgi:hypothetical protein